MSFAQILAVAADSTTVARRDKAVAAVGLTLAAVWFVLHLSNAGGWQLQATGYKIFMPVLSAVPVWLAWRASRVARTRGGRRLSLLMAGAWLAMTASSTTETVTWLLDGRLTYPSLSPLVKVFDLVVLVLVLIGLLSVPVRNRWSASRLRLGLDMACVQLAGMVFLWYFIIDPTKTGGVYSLVTFAQTAAALVVLFAIVRLVIGGVSEVSRSGLLCYAAAGVANLLMGVAQTAFADDPDRLHFALAAWALMAGLLTAGERMQLRDAGQDRVVAASTHRPASVLPYFAVAATFVLLLVALRDGLDGSAKAVLAGAMLLTGLVVIRQIVAMRDNSRLLVQLDDSLHALRSSMAREQVLGDLGTALLNTTEVAEVHRLAVRAAGTMISGLPDGRAAIFAMTPDEPETFIVTEASGTGSAELAGRRLAAAAMPTELLVRLAGGEVVTAADLGGLDLAGDAPLEPAADGADPAGLDRREHRPLTLLPLVNGERFFGVLSISAGAALPEDLRKSLEALRTQVSLALDSVALTDELTVRAMTDALTGLGNRALLRDRLVAALARAKRSGRPVGVLLLDLNGFKPINDTYGHDAGDEMLRVVADRLRDSVRTEDVVGRLGGDEFVVIAEDLRSAQDAIVVAERIVESLNRTVPYGRHELCTPASLGIALSHSETTGPDELLRLADAAMYVAKRAGAGGYHLYGKADTTPALS
jgi:diguanylate cyclase (GGDEF)-like protein